MVDRPGVGSVFGGTDDDDDFEITGGSDGGKPSTPPKTQQPKRAVPPARQSGVPSATQSPPSSGVPSPLSGMRRPGASLPAAPKRATPPSPTTPVARPTPGLPTKPTIPTPVAPQPVTPTPVTPPQPVAAPVQQQPTPEPVRAPVYSSPAPSPITYQEPVSTPAYQQPISEVNPPTSEFRPTQEQRPTYEQQWQRDQEPAPVSRPRSQDQEEPVRKGRGRKSAPVKGKKGKNTKGNTDKSVEKGPSQLSGGRKGVIFFRVALFSVMILLAGLGAKSVIAPPSFPGPEAVVERVKDGLGMTEFPVASGEGFILGFSRAYLQFDPAERNERDLSLQNYAPDAVLSNIRMSFSGSNPPAQTITAGPFITGSRSVDDTNAVYTVSAEINGSNWVYLEVPLFYKADERAFAISGSPAFIGPPTQAEIPGQPLDGIPDDKLGQAVEERLERFFVMWGSSDITGLDTLLTPDADPRARYGLGGTVTFVNINTITILEAKADTNPSIRSGRIQVVWGSPSSPETTYTQTYDIVIEKLDDDRWYVKDILGGVTSETGGGTAEKPSQPATEIVPTEVPAPTQ